MSVGDLNSNERGTGARFNDGKPELDLIPLRILAEHAAGKLQMSSLQLRCVHAMYHIADYQEGADTDSLMLAIEALDDDDFALEECAQVFSYGRDKYSPRGDCNCSAGNAARLKQSNGSASDAETAMRRISEQEIQSMPKDSGKTGETGTPRILNESRRSSAAEAPSDPLIQVTEKDQSINGSRQTTGSNEPSTTPSWPQDAPSADQPSDLTSTIVTRQEEPGECYAIPATLALDLSNGLTDGLRKHAPTCGVHRVLSNAGEWNWAKGMNWSIPLGCIGRHFRAIMRGEYIDQDSKLPHRGHIMCNIVMLQTYADIYPDGDNRPQFWRRPHSVIHTPGKESHNPALDPDVAAMMPPGAPESSFTGD